CVAVKHSISRQTEDSVSQQHRDVATRFLRQVFKAHAAEQIVNLRLRRTCALAVRRLHNKPNKVSEPNHFLARCRFRALPELNSLEFRALRLLREPRGVLCPVLDLCAFGGAAQIVAGYAARQGEPEYGKNSDLACERTAVARSQSLKRSSGR